MLVYRAVAVLLVAVCGACLYDEKLELRPLPGQHLLASFQFKLQSEQYDASGAGNVTHFGVFPKALPPVMQETGASELHIRFAQGWYDSELWGELPGHGARSGGSGVELWAAMAAPSEAAVQRQFVRLANALSALFCASLNFIDASTTSFPRAAFQPSAAAHVPADHQLYLLRSALPREPVCTENLTPFLKMLPTKGKGGVAALLDGHKVFDAQWNSMSIDVVTVYAPDGSYHYDMDLNIELVMDVARKLEINANPIIKPIPGDRLRCDTSKRHDAYHCFPSRDHADLEIDVVALFGKHVAGAVPFADSWSQVCALADPQVWDFRALVAADSGLGEVAHSFVRRSGNETCFYIDVEKPYNFVLTTHSSDDVVPVAAPRIFASRSLSGYSQDSAALRSVVHNPGPDSVDVVYFETLPWFMRPYLSTLKIAGAEVHDVHYGPARDRQRPSHLELTLTVPANSSATIGYDFDKSLLLIAEYPSDANHGFDIEPAIVTVLDPEGVQVYQMRTTSLLVTLPTPDFSMPYNVIILTGTVTSLVFGAIFQMLYKRVLTVDELEAISRRPKVVDKLRAKVAGLTARFVKKQKAD